MILEDRTSLVPRGRNSASESSKAVNLGESDDIDAMCPVLRRKNRNTLDKSKMKSGHLIESSNEPPSSHTSISAFVTPLGNQIRYETRRIRVVGSFQTARRKGGLKFSFLPDEAGRNTGMSLSMCCISPTAPFSWASSSTKVARFGSSVDSKGPTRDKLGTCRRK